MRCKYCDSCTTTGQTNELVGTIKYRDDADEVLCDACYNYYAECDPEEETEFNEEYILDKEFDTDDTDEEEILE